MRALGIVLAVLFAFRVEMRPSRLEIRGVALPYRVNVKRVRARRQLRSLEIDLYAVLSFRQHRRADFLSLSIVNISVPHLGHGRRRENRYRNQRQISNVHESLLYWLLPADRPRA